MVRPLEEQFPPEIVNQIREIVSTVGQIHYPRGTSRYYAVELQYVLESGALLGALSLACTLLESVVRGLVLQHAASVARPTLNLEQDLEANRHLGFRDLVEKLEEAGLFEPVDADRAVALYRVVRIPIHHALSRRFVRFHEDGWSANLWELLRQPHPVSSLDLEEVIEHNALDYISEIATIIQRNSRRPLPEQ